MKVLFAAGGTGGHLFPGLAIAHSVEEISPHSHIHFAIADNGRDEEIVKKTSFPFTMFPVSKFRRYFSLENFRDFFRFFQNIWKAIRLLRDLKPDVIFSKGGFVSLPIGIAGKLLGIPLLLHESDTAMGLANRILAKIAKKVFCGFPGTPYEYMGNPVRKEFFFFPPDRGGLEGVLENPPHLPSKGKRRPLLMVIGGSQGAQFLNEWTISNSSKILEISNILLISGKEIKHEKKEGFTIVSFLHEEFPSAVHSADVVISRSGAGSISELSAAKKCTILVPLPSSANDHQRKNAHFLSQKNAAIVWEQEEMGKKEKIDLLLSLLKNPEERKPYEENIGVLANERSSEMIARKILEFRY